MTTTQPAVLVAFDLETTGLDSILDRIIEIGAVRFDRAGTELGNFQSLVRPGRPSDPRAFAVHGITDEELSDAPPSTEVIPRFLEFLGDPSTTTLMAHNASFDAAFFGAELARIGIPSPGYTILDTLALSRQVLPTVRGHGLDSLSKRLGFDRSESHRALADARRVMRLWLALSGQVIDGSADLWSYGLGAPNALSSAPEGWEDLRKAVKHGMRVRISYIGGTRGTALREISPRRFTNRGGIPYIVAVCHLDRKEKAFRLDRVCRYELIEAAPIG